MPSALEPLGRSPARQRVIRDTLAALAARKADRLARQDAARRGAATKVHQAYRADPLVREVRG
ncbi:hypothetical protein PQ455_01550 [Sphingomonas naphthae]|uniref:Uncharacterized protein n=1 Tax=Sphingomonas naphthae TaxID=1813468 RepID=A0ABY7TNG8_9SPHN|nr:hypothetical protein [Sphingomonas naphthae]WCT73945.1 hypothetical protein PQ455_01550 [Sphingomonas naphthae]